MYFPFKILGDIEAKKGKISQFWGPGKTMSMMNLGFQMAHLTDSLLKAAKVCQGGSGCWKVIPLSVCKGLKWVLVVISSGIP